MFHLVENNFVKITFGVKFPGGGEIQFPRKRPRIDTGPSCSRRLFQRTGARMLRE